MLSAQKRWFLGYAGAALVAGFGACGNSGDGKLPVVPTGTGGSSAGTGGSTAGTGGSTAGTGGSTAGTGGTTAGTGGSSTGGAGGSSGSGGSVDASTSDAVTTPDGGAGETAPAGWAGIPGIENLMTVNPSPGCGMPPTGALGQWVRNTITITTPRPARGTGNRVYHVKLPTAYMNTKPYRLVVGGSGCNGNGTDVPDFTGVAGADGVIHVALEIERGVHIIDSGVNCFDDKKTDSVEYEFLAQTLAAVKQRVCYDEHRVFVTGHSSGGWLSNQLGCVFGSKLVRAIAPSSGGLAAGAGVAPPCSDLPLPGIWTANSDDTEAPGPTRDAVERALKVNKCTGGTTVAAPRMPYAVPGNTNACEKFTGCPAEFPVVWCHPNGGAHAKNTWHEAAAWQFWKSLP